MKKRKFIGLCASSFLTLAAGYGQEQTPSKTKVAPSKILIAYYSWGGNTRFAAEKIQEETGGTLFEIKPVEAYPSEYQACTQKAKKDIQAGFKPELLTKFDNIAQYDLVFIGTPNWWSTIAPPVATFASTYDLTGKKVIPFVTHGGGGLARCADDLRKLCPNSTFLKSGVFPGNGIRGYKSAISDWVESIISIQN